MAELEDEPKESPLFRTAVRNAKRLTKRAMSGHDICLMMKRRLERAGLPDSLSPHSFRVATATDLLEQGVPVEDVQYLLGHADARTTRLIVRVRTDHNPGILSALSTGIPNELGSLVMQPKTLRVLKQRAEGASGSG